MAKVGITDTILRDAHQSQAATRMRFSQMEPAFEKLDKVGYFSLECWGGATFDSCLRFLNEDPWERLRKLRKGLPNTKLQMLLRGQNLLGYKHYADDVVDFFVKKTVENGCDIIRCFDALNDLRNMETAVKATKKYGGTAEVAMSYTISPVHTEDYFVKLAADIAKMGADIICIKDMANLLLPYKAYSLIKRLKAETNLPIVLHTHDTTGTGAMTLLKAVEAGADIIYTCSSPFAEGTSQPATESMAIALEALGYKTGLDIDKLEAVAAHFLPIRNRFLEEGGLNPKVMAVEPKALLYKVPGGMLSNLLANLKDMHVEDKYAEVLAEVPRVRADLGYPPLVTPLSQMVGSQALMNVISGERYKVVPAEIKDYVRGQYGRPPVTISEKIRRQIIGDDEAITCRPADLIEPQMPRLREEISQYARSEEDVLSYALFPEQARDFLGRREDPFYDVPVQEVNVSIDVA